MRLFLLFLRTNNVIMRFVSLGFPPSGVFIFFASFAVSAAGAHKVWRLRWRVMRFLRRSARLLCLSMCAGSKQHEGTNTFPLTLPPSTSFENNKVTSRHYSFISALFVTAQQKTSPEVRKQNKYREIFV